MPQKQGSSSTAGGRVDGSVGTAVVAADFVLGAGWGTTAPAVTVTAGSNDVRGQIVVTSSGASQAQATATVTFTFRDGAYASAPFAFVNLETNTNAITERQPTGVSATTTALTWCNSVLPVDTKTYTFSYLLVA